ncbi:ABC transporter permease [Thermoflexus hugenholtzii]
MSREAIILFLRTMIARAYPRIVGQNREPSWVLIDVGLPLLGTSAYVFIYRALQAPEAYIGFVILGGAMTAFWLNVLWSMSSQLYWEKESGNLPLFIIAPGPMMGILAGMALGGMLATTLRASVIVLAGSLLFGVRYAPADPLALIGSFLLTLLALYGLGMLLASLFLMWGREAWHLSNLLQEPIYLLSGFYFPIRALGFWVGALASLIPLTLGLDAMRQLLFPQAASGLFPVGIEIAGLAALSGIFLLAAHRALNAMERLARREGRLTERRR